MITRRGAIGALAAAMVAGTALVAAVPASALTTRSASDATPNANLELVATAKCHRGERVISGGFKGRSEAYAVVSHAMRSRKWTVRTLTFGSDDTLTAFAYCSSSQRTSRESNTVTADSVHPHGELTTARCSSGTSAVAGGYAFDPTTDGDNAPVYESRRQERREWGVSAVFPMAPTDFTVFVYCQHHPDVTVREARSAPIGDGETGSAEATCRPGEQLLSGGYESTPRPDWNNTSGPDFFYNRSSRSGPRSWKAAAINYSSASGRIHAFAYCKG